MLTVAPAADDAPALKLTLRSRVSPPGEPAVAAAEKAVAWEPKRTAIIVCDMWDDYWCQSASWPGR